MRTSLLGVAGVAVFALASVVCAEGVPTLLQVSATNGQSQVELAWLSEADAFYEIYSTTNLAAGPWELAVADPLVSTNLIGSLQLLSADKSRFFQVRKLDTQGPEIVSRYPGSGTVGVGRISPLSVVLSDASGLNTNSIRLTVNGTNILSNGSAGVSVTTNSFVYTPADFWGDYGGTVTVSFACLDLKGNATYVEWVFTVEVLPVVADNLLHLATVQPMKTTNARSLMSMPARPGVQYLGGLTLIEQTADSLTFGYSGSHELYVGAVLVSHDATNPFYRRITSLADDPANGRVTAYTADVPLTDIVQQGSFSPEVFIPAGGQPQALGVDGDLSVGIPFTYNHDFAAGTLEWPNVRLSPSKLNVKLYGTLELSCQIRNWQVMALGADIDSRLDMEIRSGVDFYGEIEFLSRTAKLGSAPLATVGGMIGPVPVWIELQFAADLTFEAKTEGSISFYTGYDVFANANASLDWTAAGGLTHAYGGSIGVVPVPLDVPVKLSAEANLYLKPRLSALVCSLAGISFDYRRGACLEAEYRLGDSQCAITLSDKWSFNGALTIEGVDDGALPEVAFVEESNIIGTWYWPDVPDSAPVFTRHPDSVLEAVPGSVVTLSASASGNPAPAYQWYRNGVKVDFATLPALTFKVGDASVGRYTVVANNALGSATSITADVKLAGTRRLSVIGYTYNAITDTSVLSKLTHAIVFSLRVNPDASLNTANTPSPTDLAGMVANARSVGTKVLVAVGGDRRSENIGNVAVDPARRAVLAANLRNYCQSHNLDGVDIDWEFPLPGAEQAAFFDLISSVREALGPDLLLSLAAKNVWEDYLTVQLWTHVDWVSLMAYGVDDRNPALPHSPRSLVDNLGTWNAKGVPKDRLVLGIPFYGRNAANEQPAYSSLVALYNPAPNLDEANGYTFNGCDTVAFKTEYARKNGYAGVMIWEMGQDMPVADSRSLLRTISGKGVPTAPVDMALIPAGAFLMGDVRGGTALLPHPVCVSAFYMDKTEVTKAKWFEVAAWAAANGYDISAGSAAGKALSHPAFLMNWFACVKWCNARSQKEGLTPCYTVGGTTYKTGGGEPDCNWTANGYRLPTEAEWEKAARGGCPWMFFSWGHAINHTYANYCAINSVYMSDTSPYTMPTCHPTYAIGSTPYTSPVASFAANGYGLYDMAGNVFEWCWDWYDSTYYNGSQGSDPQGPASGSGRVVRGGSWNSNADFCRAGFRYRYQPTSGSYDRGFRTVRRAQ